MVFVLPISISKCITFRALSLVTMHSEEFYARVTSTHTHNTRYSYITHKNKTPYPSMLLSIRLFGDETEDGGMLMACQHHAIITSITIIILFLDFLHSTILLCFSLSTCLMMRLRTVAD